MNRIELDTEEIELIKSLVMQADPFDTVGIAEKKVNHIEQKIISLEADLAIAQERLKNVSKRDALVKILIEKLG